MERVRLRFAPSPTGPLHIGGARSALFNYLYAKRHGGDFLLRIEDTDRERSSRESEEEIKEALRWLGIHWNEGVDQGGQYGPYRQTQRLDRYRALADGLLGSGRAYRCYCSPEELEALREEQRKRGEMPRYDGRCRSLDGDGTHRIRGRDPVIRFRVPEGRTVSVADLVRGTVVFETDGIGDFVIVKSDGIPTYNFAVVADDAAMEITHVIRGEEHLSNTPRQVLLYEALGFQAPQFAHVSLILGADRSKMSKRHGDVSVMHYRDRGFLPEGMVNFLALLGWSPGEEREIFSLEELGAAFDLDRVSRSPAVFDPEKLNWVNQQHIQRRDPAELCDLAAPFLEAAGLGGAGEDARQRERLEGALRVVRPGLEYLEQVPQAVELFYRPAVPEGAARDLLRQEYVPAMLETFTGLLARRDGLSPEAVREVFRETMETLGLKGKQVFRPVRVAITGTDSGPEMHEMIPVLGAGEVRERIRVNLARARQEETDDPAV